MKLLFEKSVPGRRGVGPGPSDVPTTIHLNGDLLRDRCAALPELSELDVVRHFTELSRRNFGVDTNFYPLGSCTMKYNPKVAERIAGYPGFSHLHPLLPQLRMGDMLAQGALAILYEMDLLLREITGMAGFTTQPMAGAHGELTGMMIMAAYHRDKGSQKTVLLAPDSAHGTNPASAAIAGYRVVSIPSGADGLMDLAALKRAIGDDVAGVMLTCPNTLGLFNPHIREICDLIHSVDGLAYYDGANLNAIVGKARPGDFGFDIVHLNLHKTFATPHGGGGPGAGPVGVKEHLVPFLPVSIVVKRADGTYTLEYDRPKSIGYVAPFYGNFGIVLRAYVYILLLGKEGLARVAENAVLNANYVRCKLKDHYAAAFDKLCKHECVFSTTEEIAANGVHAIDIAKALIDRGFHPPTVYFPTIVKEAMMIEPTETESKETLDAFITAMIEIAELAQKDPEQLKAAPVTTPVSRPNETAAAKNLNIASL
ncbi:MAG: aminomethyl-transferring glycine dehydrogenase subunit GcvPB [Sedimentisphaerales bacterium]|jgi:glycine dehydrogenase subunit 2|nr:aminomethyl-transferring glycine dehydrogenase subunit GcvPB [Sedimentisphaerales bacterium]HNY77471.1 aminomethyl-transferring glycine dehydrogenase subunit GcvPB [Sedimentisphaerales bacterium]HOC62875.1 aminomethyl-transferring glycine dehydrogenase subunit GcvPB [Sedimentisphaerales bacterium]HOH63639.1 aminomethyl-transferring glycine dehydrogenase subunit GcvPB [Sedimentisphaerales bacterium]HQA90485.1 aminomethyl-transferring glycine dehydrogenase subunit GcvPB [Sedimentisphaerales ba